VFVLIQNKHNPKIYEHSLECQLIGYSPNSKAYICYYKPAPRVITSYHVEFIESHQTVPKPLQPRRLVNIEEETPPPLPPAVTVEEQDEDDEHDTLPNKPISNPNPNPNPEEPNAPRRSSRVPDETAEERLRRAVEEAKDAGDRIRANREVKRRGYVPNENDAHALIDAITLHALIADDSQLNLEHPDDPKSTKTLLQAHSHTNGWRRCMTSSSPSRKWEFTHLSPGQLSRKAVR
jgi:type IV secretory pathway VirB10-like protein